MSTSELIGAPAPAPTRTALPGTFLASELKLVLRRRRNLGMLGVLVAAPIVIGLALRASSSSGEGDGDAPAFLGEVAGNGLFLGFSGLLLLMPFFLPLAMSVVSGDSIAGEASAGTLRYLLIVPAGRGRLLATKYASCVLFGLITTVLVVTSGMVTGAALFSAGDVTLLSGTTIGFGETLWRALLMAGYAAVLLGGLAAIGVFVSTLTEVPVAAMATVAAIPVLSQILGLIPQLSWLHPWLLTDTWSVFGDFLREPIMTEAIGRGLLTHAGYAVIFLSFAWARLTMRDITS
ncbi:ABC transporter permease [Phytoactinopolyspora halotolerans]|uniref:ABC transporter permease subunit n=1 Tax=Phytoactinopolyspora halotolerans TaxID=1981512 RepID=A0A6L9SHZ7_9ACTN|nr:ABC transporter permease subunit [Phytoactinopolyspora halotolerans]NEE04264.1 ABC transporter permease subunit [Phytoactinopolyspora halotolerans]